MKFLKTGAAAVHAAMEKDDIERATRFQPFRFWLDKGAETRITFVDGDVEGGLLVPGVAFQEHMIKKPGSKGFDNICCTQEQEECPLCLDGDRPSLVFAMTIIDHTNWKDKNGKVHEHQRRLFVCKGDTFKMLQMKATKPQPMSSSTEPMGLKFVTFNVMRIGEKSAGVGTVFDAVAKTSAEVIAKNCNLKLEDIEPLDYNKEITYLTASELRKIGHGAHHTPAVGSADTKAMTNAMSGQGSEGKAADTGSAFKVGGKSAFNPANEM
jgi:hypothetical protein